MGLVAKGENPAEDIAQHRRAPSVTALCERFFAANVMETSKPTTQAEYRRAIDKFIIPAIGAFRVVDVRRKDIAELQHKHRDIPYQANAPLACCQRCSISPRSGDCAPTGRTPAAMSQSIARKNRERFLSQQELQRLGQVLSEAEQDDTESPFIVAGFRLLILTGCRLGEIQTLKWAYIKPRHIELPDSKVGARRVPLPEAARDVLDALPRQSDNPYIIAGQLERSYATDFQRPWRRIWVRAERPNTRIHDLRHTYASMAVSGGMAIQMVGRLLGHSQL